MSKSYQISSVCKNCKVRATFTGLIDEQPACPACGHREDPEKLAKARAAMDAFEADPVKQAEIRAIQDAVDRGEDPCPDITALAQAALAKDTGYVGYEDDGDPD